MNQTRASSFARLALFLACLALTPLFASHSAHAMTADDGSGDGSDDASSAPTTGGGGSVDACGLAYANLQLQSGGQINCYNQFASVAAAQSYCLTGGPDPGDVCTCSNGTITVFGCATAAENEAY